jgi:hypothetical protein
LANYWKNGFDWKKQEAKLNELPHFKTKVEVDGFGDLDMHFIHQKSNVPGAIPLLFVHGCESSPCRVIPLSRNLSYIQCLYRILILNAGPGNFLEVTKLLPLLKDTKDGPAFHIVAPSLPNYGFSSRMSKVRAPFGIAFSI